MLLCVTRYRHAAGGADIGFATFFDFGREVLLPQMHMLSGT